MCKRISLVIGWGGGGASVKTLSFPYMLNSKNRVRNWYLFNEKSTFADNSRVEPTIFFMKNILFSLKLFSGHFNELSFIKTV